MKTIVEIFESNPSLLETKEVKELVEQFKIQFQANKMKYYNYWNAVTELTINSELFVIKGMSCPDVIEKITELSLKDHIESIYLLVYAGYLNIESINITA